jgi:16S rRNA (uracil1498-N3)-methyltransferase
VAAAHAFVADLEAPELAPDDRRHLERVLRLRAGEELTVADGAGRWRRCRFGPDLEVAGPVRVEERARPDVTIALALTKGQRLDWAVQKLTEIGVDRIVPMTAARSVVRWDGGRASQHVERLRRIARQAAMQSRRAWLPTVTELQAFPDVVRLSGAALADRGAARPPTLATPTVLVGPEGGWDEPELATGLPRVALSPHVLRAETAAVTAATLLTAMRAGLVTGAS